MSLVQCKPQTIKKAFLGEKIDRDFYKRLETVSKELIAGHGVRIHSKIQAKALQLLEKTYGLYRDCVLSCDDGCCHVILFMPHCICTFLGYEHQTRTFDEPYSAGTRIQLNHKPAFPQSLFIIKNSQFVLHYGEHFTVADDELVLVYGSDAPNETDEDVYCIYNQYKSGGDCPTCGFGCQHTVYSTNYAKNMVIGIDDPFLIPDSVRVVWKERFHLKPGKDFLVTADGDVQVLFEGEVEPDCPHDFVITWAQYGEFPSPNEPCRFSNYHSGCIDVDPFDDQYFIRLNHCPVECSLELYFDCRGGNNNVLIEGEDYTIEENIINIDFASEKAGRFCYRYAY